MRTTSSSFVDNLRPRVAESLGGGREARKHIEFGNDGGGLPNAARLFGDPVANLLKELLLDLEHLFFGSQDLLFVFLQFRCDESFGADQRLLAIVVLRNQVKIRFGDLDVVAEDSVEANLQRSDSGSLAFADFDGGEICLAVLSKATAVRRVRHDSRRESHRHRPAQMGDRR